MVNRCLLSSPSLLALELLVKVEDGAVVVLVVHVAHAAPTGRVMRPWVSAHGCDGAGWEGVGALGRGDGVGGAVAGAAAAEGHAVYVGVLWEGLVEGVAGHFQGFGVLERWARGAKVGARG